MVHHRLGSTPNIRAKIGLLFPVGSIILLFLVAAGLYWPVLHFPFAPWDDREYILENPIIRSLSIEHLRAMFTLRFVGNYSPVHILAYAIQFRLWGLWVPGYHAVNIALHGVNACLIVALCLRLGMPRGVSLLGGLLFLVHPVQVESVVWISELKTLLAAAFFLGSFILYIRGRGGGGRWFSVASVLLFSLACLTKPSAVAYPLLILVYNFLFHRDGMLKSLRRASPFFVISLLTGLMAIGTQTDGRWGGQGWHDRLGAVWSVTGVVVLEYVQHLFLPFHLSPYYYIVPEEVTAVAKVTGGLILLLLLALTAHSMRAGRRESLFAAWFFILLLPNSNVFPLDVLIADRYLYLPGIGLLILVSMAIVRIWEMSHGAYRKGLIGSLVGVMVIVSGWRTLDHSAVWSDDVTFFRTIGEENPAPRVLVPLVVAYEKRGETALTKETAVRAIESVQGELRRQPDNWQLYWQLGLVYEKIGREDDAKPLLQKAVELSPDASNAVIRLSGIYMREKNFAEARRLLEPNVRRFPYLLEPRVNLVQALAGLGDYREARREAEEIVRLWPESVLGVALLADVSKITGDRDRAIALYRKVMEMDPGSKFARDSETMIRSLEDPR